MLNGLRQRLTYGNVMSTIAVFGVLAGGGAYAAATIGPGDIKPRAVRGKHIAANAVNSKRVRDEGIKSKDLKDGKGVEGRDVADGSIGVDKLTANGELVTPTLGDGGQGDCVWTDVSSIVAGLNPVGYYEDRFGTVHLSGHTVVSETAGAGDEECGATPPEPDDTVEDVTIFTLPEGLRPQNAMLLPVATGTSDTTGAVVVVGTTTFDLNGNLLPAGSIVGSVGPGDTFALDGISFPTAEVGVFPAGPSAAEGGEGELSLDGLEGLLGG